MDCRWAGIGTSSTLRGAGGEPMRPLAKQSVCTNSPVWPERVAGKRDDVQISRLETAGEGCFKRPGCAGLPGKGILLVRIPENTFPNFPALKPTYYFLNVLLAHSCFTITFVQQFGFSVRIVSSSAKKRQSFAQ